MYEEINKKEPLPGPKATKASKKVFETTKQKQEEKKKSEFKLGRFKNVTSKIKTTNNALKALSPANSQPTVTENVKEVPVEAPIEDPKQDIVDEPLSKEEI